MDLLGEDLYRKGQKPYIDLPEIDLKDEEVAAREAWNRHLYRNESVITDLFHGQYKSTVSCSKCDRVSVTFDPMMTMLLPIPEKKQQLSFFFIPYNITENYINKSGSLVIRANERIMDLRHQLKEKYGIPLASYTVAKVNNNEFTRFFSTETLVEQTLN